MDFQYAGTTPGSSGDYAWYHDLAFYYDKGKNLRMVLRGKWLDGDGPANGLDPTDYERTWAREF